MELGNSDTEDEEQDHVEVINLTVTEVTQEAAAVTTAEATPPELPLTLDQFQQIKVDLAFANVSTDIRMREKKLLVERLPKNWDAKRKEKLKKGKQGTYVIPKRKTGTSGLTVGSTPTSLPLKGAP